MKNAALLVLLCLTGCYGLKDSSPQESARETLLQKLDTALIGENLLSRQSVKHFYELRGNKFFWSAQAQVNLSADTLLQIIRQSGRWGLDPEWYHSTELHRLLSDTVSADRFGRSDVLLTDAWLTLYSHVMYGVLDSRTLQLKDYARMVNKEAIALLERIDATSIGPQLRRVEPHFTQYEDLKEALGGLIAGTGKPEGADAMKISVNMERWKWQKPLPQRYVSVNIPAFMLRVFEKDSLWLETKVIVGKRETPTPIMQSVITSFIIYPYWHVPKSISTKEILPALQRDGSYLRRNNFDVLDANGDVVLADTIQWDFYNADNFPFILRQREGTENSMGIIKFNFANNYGVYLHDTNSKRLFQRASRDFSHGCVRVSNAVAFAHYLVHEDDIYVSPEDLDQYLSLQQRLKIELRKPIPLKLEYFTAEVGNGVLKLYDDIYKKDSVMMEVMFPKMAGDTIVTVAAGQ